MDISANGRRVVSSAWDRETLLWDAGKAPRSAAPLPIPTTAGLRVAVFRPKHRDQLVVWTDGRSLQTWDTQLKVQLRAHKDVFDGYGTDKLLISPDGRFVTVGTKQSAKIADLNAFPPRPSPPFPTPTRSR
ncbi:MAG: hypothetical protein JWO38_1618 [Gemmataceae bacterium]|nr:hypothetical protein [Gemmataceae bacterium]